MPVEVAAPRPAAPYAPGAVPPPHPSPFVDYDASLPGEAVGWIGGKDACHLRLVKELSGAAGGEHPQQGRIRHR